MVPSHADTVDGSVNSFWLSISGPAGMSGDINKLGNLLHENFLIAGTSANNPDKLRFSDKDAFLQSMQKPRKQGFYECELYRDSRVTESFASVLSVVESRVLPQVPRDSQIGINNIQLQFLEGRWQILSLHYYVTELQKIEVSLQLKFNRVCLNPM